MGTWSAEILGNDSSYDAHDRFPELFASGVQEASILDEDGSGLSGIEEFRLAAKAKFPISDTSLADLLNEIGVKEDDRNDQ